MEYQSTFYITKPKSSRSVANAEVPKGNMSHHWERQTNLMELRHSKETAQLLPLRALYHYQICTFSNTPLDVRVTNQELLEILRLCYPLKSDTHW